MSQPAFIVISAATESSPFNLVGELGVAIVSASAEAPTLTLQLWSETDSTWADTGLTHNASASNPTVISSSQLAEWASGTAGKGYILRWKCSVSATVTIEHYSSIVRTH